MALKKNTTDVYRVVYVYKAADGSTVSKDINSLIDGSTEVFKRHLLTFTGATTSQHEDGKRRVLDGASVDGMVEHDALTTDESLGTVKTGAPDVPTKSDTTYTVSYDKNGGTGTTSNSTGSITYTDGTWSGYDHTAAIKADKTYTASYTANYPTITLRANGFTAPSAATATITTTWNANGGTCSTSTSDTTKTTTHSFNKWGTAASGGTEYSAGTNFSPSSGTSTKMYAHWKDDTPSYSSTTAPTPTVPNNVTGTINIIYHKGDESTSSVSGTMANTAITKTTSYSNKGWYNAASGGTKIVDVGGSYKPTSSGTLYAQYTPSWAYDPNPATLRTNAFTKANYTQATYTVTYNKGNGDSVNKASESKDYIRTYSFKEWNTAENGSGTSYANKANYASLSGNVTSNINLYAQWTIGGSLPTVTTTTATKSNTTSTVTTTYNGTSGSNGTKTIGWSFDGWYNAATGGSKIAGASESLSLSQDTNLYARFNESSWSTALTTAAALGNSNQSQVTITYNKGDGSSVGKASDTTTPYKVFSKWRYNGTDYKASTAYNISGDVSSIAFTPTYGSTQYPALTATTATKNSTTSVVSTTYDSVSGSNGTKTTSYTLDGWYDAASGGSKVVGGGESFNPTSTATLYARFNESSWSTTGTTSAALANKNETNTVDVTYDKGNGSTVSKSKDTITPYRVFSKWRYNGVDYSASSSYTISGNLNSIAFTSTWGGIKYPSVTTATATKANTTSFITTSYKGEDGRYLSFDDPDPDLGISIMTTSYTHSGWFSAATGGTKYATSGGSYTPSSDSALKLYAQFTESAWSTPIKMPAVPTKANTNTSTSYTLTYRQGVSTGVIPSAQEAYVYHTHTNGKWRYDGVDYVGNTTNTLTEKLESPVDFFAVYTESGNINPTITLAPAVSKANTDSTSYTVTYNENKELLSESYDTVKDYLTYTQTGWYDSESGGTKIGNCGSSYTLSANKTAYPQYSSTVNHRTGTLPEISRANKEYGPYTFSSIYKYRDANNYSLDTGAALEPTVKDLQVATITPYDTYSLTKWASNKDSSFSGVSGNTHPISDNTTFTAQWNATRNDDSFTFTSPQSFTVSNYKIRYQVDTPSITGSAVPFIGNDAYVAGFRAGETIPAQFGSPTETLTTSPGTSQTRPTTASVGSTYTTYEAISSYEWVKGSSTSWNDESSNTYEDSYSKAETAAGNLKKVKLSPNPPTSAQNNTTQYLYTNVTVKNYYHHSDYGPWESSESVGTSTTSASDAMRDCDSQIPWDARNVSYTEMVDDYDDPPTYYCWATYEYREEEEIYYYYVSATRVAYTCKQVYKKNVYTCTKANSVSTIAPYTEQEISVGINVSANDAVTYTPTSSGSKTIEFGNPTYTCAYTTPYFKPYSWCTRYDSTTPSGYGPSKNKENVLPSPAVVKLNYVARSSYVKNTVDSSLFYPLTQKWHLRNDISVPGSTATEIRCQAPAGNGSGTAWSNTIVFAPSALAVSGFSESITGDCFNGGNWGMPNVLFLLLWAGGGGGAGGNAGFLGSGKQSGCGGGAGGAALIALPYGTGTIHYGCGGNGGPSKDHGKNGTWSWIKYTTSTNDYFEIYVGGGEGGDKASRNGYSGAIFNENIGTDSGTHNEVIRGSGNYTNYLVARSQHDGNGAASLTANMFTIDGTTVTFESYCAGDNSSTSNNGRSSAVGSCGRNINSGLLDPGPGGGGGSRGTSSNNGGAPGGGGGFTILY